MSNTVPVAILRLSPDVADLKFPQIFAELVLLLIVGVALGVGAGGFAVAGRSGRPGLCGLFRRSRRPDLQDALPSAPVSASVGSSSAFRISALICRQTGDFAPPPAAKSLVGWMLYFGELFPDCTASQRSGPREWRGRYPRAWCAWSGRRSCARAGQHVRRAAHALQERQDDQTRRLGRAGLVQDIVDRAAALLLPLP